MGYALYDYKLNLKKWQITKGIVKYSKLIKKIHHERYLYK